MVRSYWLINQIKRNSFYSFICQFNDLQLHNTDITEATCVPDFHPLANCPVSWPSLLSTAHTLKLYKISADTDEYLTTYDFLSYLSKNANGKSLGNYQEEYYHCEAHSIFIIRSISSTALLIFLKLSHSFCDCQLFLCYCNFEFKNSFPQSLLLELPVAWPKIFHFSYFRQFLTQALIFLLLLLSQVCLPYLHSWLPP